MCSLHEQIALRVSGISQLRKLVDDYINIYQNGSLPASLQLSYFNKISTKILINKIKFTNHRSFAS